MTNWLNILKMATNPKIIVVGGGLAGLGRASRSPKWAAQVDLFSIVPVKRSHSVCAQGGINAAKNLKGEGDSTAQHFDDTIYGGDFLANQPPVKAMCEAAPGIIDLLDRMGVPFNRTPEGLLDFRRFGGTLYNRTAFAGATTGQQLLYALDEQVRRYESEGKVKKYEYWEFLSAVLDDNGVCRGICAIDLRSMEVRTFPADAVIIATGGIGAIFGKSTNSVVCTGSAQSALYQQGAFYANGEFIQVHPTCIPGEDKLRLMSESARGEGGRVWVPKTPGDKRDPKQIPENERWYFLEEWYPKYGNLVPRDVATRAIFKVVFEHKSRHRRQADGLSRPDAYRPRDARPQAGRHPGDLRKVCGRRSARYAHEDFPWHALHHGRPLGGLQSGHQHLREFTPRASANISTTAPTGWAPIRWCPASSADLRPGPMPCATPRTLQIRAQQWPLRGRKEKSQEENNALLMNNQGDENPFRLWRELGELMTENCTVIRYNKNLEATDAKLVELLDRFQRREPERSDAVGEYHRWFLPGNFTTCCNSRA